MSQKNFERIPRLRLNPVIQRFCDLLPVIAEAVHLCPELRQPYFLALFVKETDYVFAPGKAQAGGIRLQAVVISRHENDNGSERDANRAFTSRSSRSPGGR